MVDRQTEKEPKRWMILEERKFRLDRQEYEISRATIRLNLIDCRTNTNLSRTPHSIPSIYLTRRPTQNPHKAGSQKERVRDNLCNLCNPGSSTGNLQEQYRPALTLFWGAFERDRTTCITLDIHRYVWHQNLEFI